jgi:hypothetical protein
MVRLCQSTNGPRQLLFPDVARSTLPTDVSMRALPAGSPRSAHSPLRSHTSEVCKPHRMARFKPENTSKCGKIRSLSAYYA